LAADISVPGRGGRSLQAQSGRLAVANHLRTELVLDGLNIVLCQRGPEGVVH
jgi:hypothetical protein